jgi:membrane protein DedA with SNARE-associated domain
VGGWEHAIFTLISNWYMTTGYAGIVLAMTLESCCIPLPSEIVMPLAGLYVTQHPERFSLLGVGLAGAVGCLIGSAAAYGIGAAGGRPLLLRYGRYVLISRRDADRADRWFARHGAPTAFFARLVPIVRTYISLPAGIARMNFGQFLLWTFLGSLPWTFALAYAGERLGPQVLQLTTLFHGADIVVLVLLVAAVALYVYRHLHSGHVATDELETPPPPQRRAAPGR